MINESDAWLYRPDMRGEPARNQERSRRKLTTGPASVICVLVMIVLYGLMTGLARAVLESRPNDIAAAVGFIVLCLAGLARVAREARRGR